MRFLSTKPEKPAPGQGFSPEKKVLSALGKRTAPVRPPKNATILGAIPDV
jgi:hypothetical protein